MTRLSSSSPVTASTRSGGRLMPARSSTNSSVASPRCTTCSNSSSSASKRSARCSISVTSWSARRSRRARFAPTLPPPQIRTYISRPRPVCGTSQARTASVDLGDRRLRRAHDPQPALAVEHGARRVEQAHDDALVGEALLRDLADDDVRVVAVGRDDDRVRVLDAGGAKHVDVHAVSEHEAAAPVLAEPRERVLLLVDRRDLPALAEQLPRDRGADAPAADDYRFHDFKIAATRPRFLHDAAVGLEPAARRAGP